MKKFRFLAVLSATILLLGMTGCKKESSINVQELEQSLVGVWWDEFEYEDVTEDGVPFSRVLLAVQADADHTGCIYLGVFDDTDDNPLVIYGGPAVAGFTWKLLSDGSLELGYPSASKSIAITRADDGSYGDTMTDVSGTSMTYTGEGVTMNNGTYSSTLTKADAGKQADIRNLLTVSAASEDGTRGIYTDSKGRSRECIVTTILNSRYVIATAYESENATITIEGRPYYNWDDARKLYAGGKTDGSYTRAGVWRLPTVEEMYDFAHIENDLRDREKTTRTWYIGRGLLKLPANGGYVESEGNYELYDEGFCWTSTPQSDHSSWAMVFSVRSVGKDGRFDGYNNILGYSVLLFCKLPSDAQISTEGAVKGKFTINDYGDQVYFSKGNLQYADGSWQFAANQWEYFGTDQRDGHRDLFGWGTKDSPDKVSGNNGDYSWAEWGDNTITNGLTGYRTLTFDEWRYLFFNRDGKSGLAKINDINGVVLLPDEWTLPDGCSFTPGYEGSYGNNTYSEAQWAIMEKAGAVFLPAAGYRSGDGTDLVNVYPYYWSSTMHSADDAYDFSYTTKWYVAWAGKSVGMSVRLVKDVM